MMYDRNKAQLNTAADLMMLRLHEDKVTATIEVMPRIEKLIALKYLRMLLGVAIEDTGREIMEEYRKELKG